MPQFENELLTLPEHTHLLLVCCEVRFAQSLVVYVVFCKNKIATVLFVCLQFKASDYLFVPSNCLNTWEFILSN